MTTVIRSSFLTLFASRRDFATGSYTRPTLASPQGLIDEVHHRGRHLRRRVVGAGPLTQRVVIKLEEVLVEVQPGLGFVLADRMPINYVENARERAQRRLERLLIWRIVSQDPQ